MSPIAESMRGTHDVIAIITPPDDYREEYPCVAAKSL